MCQYVSRSLKYDSRERRKAALLSRTFTERVSATYKIFDDDGYLVMEVDESRFLESSAAWLSDGKLLTFRCDILQTISNNNLDRFSVEWIMND